jgi:hypothetical protein
MTGRGGICCAGLLWALLFGVSAGCVSDDVVAIRRCAGASCPVADSGFCAAAGPEVAAAQDSTLCGGKLIAASLPAALCVCGTINGGDFQSDGFDSALGPYVAGQPGGDVGATGALTTSGSWDVGGALRAFGATAVKVTGSLKSRGLLSVQGGLLGDSVSASADAEVGGDISLQNLSVAGTLATPASSTITVTGQRMIAQSRTAAVSVPAPCPCELDPYVSGPILAIEADNQTAALGFDRNSLEGYSGSPVIALPCGRYFFQRVAGLGSLELRIKGRVELAIAGGLSVGGALTIALDPAAELDLYVHGDVDVGGAVAIGDPAAPARLRFFPGGVDAVRFPGGGFVSAVMLGRRRAVAISAPLDFYGALIADTLELNSVLRLHYDRQILSVAGGCPPPG